MRSHDYSNRPRTSARLCWSALLLVGTTASLAQAAYERGGETAELDTFFHDVSGTVTIIDYDTLLVENFYFDGGGPAVYFYLGETNTNGAFQNGLALMPQLTRAYNDETLVLHLPAGESMNDYDAISVWCAAVNVNFGSGSFDPPVTPYARAGWFANFHPGSHNTNGFVTIINDHVLYVEHFRYDGLAPAVYFYLGATDSDDDFMNGLPLMPELDRAYANESLVLTLPAGDTLDGWGAISVWCAEFDVNFTSAPFVQPVLGDLDCDGQLTFSDINAFVLALGDEEGYAMDYPGCDRFLADVNQDGFITFADIVPFVDLF